MISPLLLLTRLTDADTAARLIQGRDEHEINKIADRLRKTPRRSRQVYVARLLGEAGQHSVMGTLLVAAHKAGEI